MNNLLFPVLRQRSMMQWLLMLVLLTYANGVWAAARCQGGGTTETILLPATISVPRNAAPGTVLVPWTTTGWVNYYCTVTESTATGIRAAAMISSDSYPRTLTANLPGGDGATIAYRVLQTPVSGIGLAVAFNAKPNGCGPGWVDVFESGNQMQWTGASCNAMGNNWANKGQFAVAIVTTGTVSAGELPAQTIAKTTSVISGVPSSDGTTAHYLAMPPVRIIPMTCEIPDVPVSLGSHFPREFGDTGTTTAVDFNISLNNCPAGMNGIQYRIDPTTTVIDDTQSVVALSNISGSATGIGVQLLNGSGNAFKLQNQTVFNGYNKTTGGSYTIPMKARYYKTGSVVTPGTANTTMTVTMSYQ